jgi:hypothetical protein
VAHYGQTLEDGARSASGKGALESLWDLIGESMYLLRPIDD